MAHFFTIVSMSSFLLLQAPVLYSQSDSQPPAKTATPLEDLADLPPAPHGRTTIFGGMIRNLDPIRDELTLGVVGEHPMHILFDERTRVFRDGKRIPLQDLRATEHASVETTLDKGKVFAVSIHILSGTPEGEYQGSVLNYDSSNGALSIRASSSPAPFKIFVTANTRFSRFGQPQFRSVGSGTSDLIPGSLISVTFRPSKDNRAAADAITVLAVPGSTFVFTGNLISIDLHTGVLELVDPRDQKQYQVSFNASLFPASRTLHAGDHVRVSARYDGAGFVASEMAAN
ncbi:MAG TPA: hypothetical protein VHD85_13365 [Terracidiphilus sp.]|nr:hypothetical protein [Terracidiphilus sp.]